MGMVVTREGVFNCKHILFLRCVYILNDVLIFYVRRVVYKKYTPGGYLRTFFVTNHTVDGSTACTHSPLSMAVFICDHFTIYFDF